MPSPESGNQTVDRIIVIIRRDLMLGADVEIGEQTRLFGGDFDLDSLDALLLVQSLEKDFGFEMSSDTFGPEVFESVASLARFVQARGDAPAPSVDS